MLSTASPLAAAEPPATNDPDRFVTTIAPLLAGRCLDCHNATDRKGELDLTSREAMLRGGDSGPAYSAEQPTSSLIWRRVVDDEMPPKCPLSVSERTALQQWLDEGAEWPTGFTIDRLRYTNDRRAGADWWSLPPVSSPQPPEVQNSAWPRGDLDRFVLARLEAAGLAPSPEADRATLIRRLSFDLIGLPPSPEEVAAFAADDSPDAYERLVDRLLDSPQYGERWARHWLDLARFGESHGFEYDEPRRHAWPYRDWVINAFNRDLPYDEFARRQIAGDAIAPDDPESIIATGFLVAAPYDVAGQNQQSAAMKQVVRQDELEDIVGTIGQTFLGMTVHCARCHDHKFDPIRQLDYYRLTAALGGVRHGERDVTPAAEQARRDAILAPARERLAALEKQTAALDANAPERPAIEQELTKVRATIASMPPRLAYVCAPRQGEPARLLLRGDPRNAADVVSAGGVAAILSERADFGLAADAPEAVARRALADWITARDNPLFARVIVNRLWLHHFGAAIVDTPNDFGFNGGRPSHPELLDFLATRLKSVDYRLKPMHREICVSAAYRQASYRRDDAALVDADNRLLWRKSPRRLEAETVRDAALAVAGELRLRVGGPGFLDYMEVNRSGSWSYFSADPVGEEFQRRSIYRTWARGGRHPLLDTFDCPDPSTTAPRRPVTTTPTQALALLNNRFMLRMADRFADRVGREAGDEIAARVARAFRLAFGRPPESDELAACARVAASHGMPAVTRVLLNSNEFLYVD